MDINSLISAFELGIKWGLFTGLSCWLLGYGCGYLKRCLHFK